MPRKLTLIGASTVSKINQVTLPKKVRERLEIKPGDMLGFYIDEDEERIVIQR